ncbi:U3 small nucleolar RNA-associated protein 6 family protein [Theileria parva strain Muguga]|uniref:U3 small nucleolar RNA-associated protein 6 family protein n=1 Tax=Theileria parva strain Muguga TaxID=333668 RepID=UPI001C61FE2E|nr:U3 small nucleolar RNA-associated protein 6 family protein [Theileria parva strain Muguga]KAF5153076.1 U3 small nucleolar RNA-associated protein 6 family protein [Theileria parva strain Muguga]
MADRVQKELEDSVPDLHELLAQKLLTFREIKSVISRRRQFEFDILSPDPNLSLISYKNYLKYELELHKFLLSRFHQFKLNHNPNTCGNSTNGHTTHNNNTITPGNIPNTPGNTNTRGNTRNSTENTPGNTNTLGNTRRNTGVNTMRRGMSLKLMLKLHSERHINGIFRRGINRFMGNTELYKLYLSYCKKMKSYKLFERVIVNGISKNPNEESLWLIFASYVLKTKGIRASKNIIQKSLRILPNNLKLLSFLMNLQLKILINHINSGDSVNGSTVEGDSVNRGIVDRGTVENDTVNNDTVEGDLVDRGTGELSKSECLEELEKCWIIFKYGRSNLSESDLKVFKEEITSVIRRIHTQNPQLKSSINKLLHNITTTEGKEY